MYIAAGMIIAMMSGWIIGRLHLEKWVEDYVYKLKVGNGRFAAMSFPDRVRASWSYVRQIFHKVAPWVALRLGIGAFIDVYAPENFLARHAGKNNPFAVLLAVLIGIPLCSNAEGLIPLV